MKKIFSVLAIMLAVVLNANAQTILDFYTNSSTPKKTRYAVMCINNGTKVLIEAHGSARQEFFMLDTDDLTKFQDGIKEMRDKYIEWCDVAKKNKISSVRKEMPYPYYGNFIGGAWKLKDWWFARGYAYFATNPVFSVHGAKKTMKFTISFVANDNDYIENDIYITFSSVSDFNSLIRAVDEKSIKAILGAENKTKDLFK